MPHRARVPQGGVFGCPGTILGLQERCIRIFRMKFSFAISSQLETLFLVCYPQNSPNVSQLWSGQGPGSAPPPPPPVASQPLWHAPPPQLLSSGAGRYYCSPICGCVNSVAGWGVFRRMSPISEDLTETLAHKAARLRPRPLLLTATPPQPQHVRLCLPPPLQKGVRLSCLSVCRGAASPFKKKARCQDGSSPRDAAPPSRSSSNRQVLTISPAAPSKASKGEPVGSPTPLQAQTEGPCRPCSPTGSVGSDDWEHLLQYSDSDDDQVFVCGGAADFLGVISSNNRMRAGSTGEAHCDTSPCFPPTPLGCGAVTWGGAKPPE